MITRRMKQYKMNFVGYQTKLLVFWTVLGVLAALCVGIAAQENEEDWIDPLDPFSHDPTTVERDYNKFMEEKRKKMESKDQKQVNPVPVSSTDLPGDKPPVKEHRPTACACNNEKRTIEKLERELSKKPAPHMPFFKQYVARLLKQLDNARQGSFESSSKFEMLIDLEDGDVEVLRQFSTHTDDQGVQSAHAVLDRMVQRVQQVDMPEGIQFGWTAWILPICWVVVAVASSLIAINLQWRVGVPWLRIVGSMLVLLFVISVPWTWWHLYQEEIVRRIAMSEKERPSECDPQSMTLWQSIKSSFSLTDKCKDFYSMLHVDPWLDVPPTKALVVTISKMVVEPLEHLGEAISKMVLACLKDLPAQLWPIALSFLFIILILLLLMCFGYKIKMFYLFGLEPSTPAIQATDRRMLEQIQNLTDQVQQITAGNRNLQQLMNEQRRSLDEQLGQPDLLALPSVRPGELSHRFQAAPSTLVAGETRAMASHPCEVRYQSGRGIPANPPTLPSDAQYERSRAGGDTLAMERVEEIEVERPSVREHEKKKSSCGDENTEEKTKELPDDKMSVTGTTDTEIPLDGGAEIPPNKEPDITTTTEISDVPKPLTSISLLPSSFGSLLQSTTVPSLSPTPGGVSVQDVGPVDLQATEPTATESSDDSDLEIIEESDSISQG